ncbi:MAG: EMC3/TMCO1 family protein [Candidatus ainarchaeum sp.]|nr:EMC3/TMCO1 family protein [Candidatus ainarchaeum sp.]
MFQAPLISYWVDIIIISLIFALSSKLIQHFTIKPKDYFYIKLKSKQINKEMKELSKVQDMQGVKEKQKEAFSMVGKQFKLQQKSMFVMLLIAFPLLWVVNKFYEVPYDFILFSVKSGFWAYVIIGIVLSIIISNIYDKQMVKKYYPSGKLD